DPPVPPPPPRRPTRRRGVPHAGRLRPPRHAGLRRRHLRPRRRGHGQRHGRRHRRRTVRDARPARRLARHGPDRLRAGDDRPGVGRRVQERHPAHQRARPAR
ncbi:MAG: hypothetical protein AVDCRST_MAG69-503, partial [uncultured Solirubrobacteraceae bacterium]